MTREQIWFENKHYQHFREQVLEHSLFVEAVAILDGKIPVAKRPISGYPPDERAADQKHWDDGFRMCLALLKGLGLPPRPKADHEPLGEPFDYLTEQEHPE